MRALLFAKRFCQKEKSIIKRLQHYHKILSSDKEKKNAFFLLLVRA
jgi:hypothetical protein